MMTAARFRPLLLLLSIALWVACSSEKKPTAAKDAAAPPTPQAVLDAAGAPLADAALAVADAAAGMNVDAGKTTARLPDAAAGDPVVSDAPTNLKVLPKGWTRQQVEKEMKVYTKALGVKCEFCHDVKDHAADGNKHKDVARKMISMTNSMNGQYFKGAKQKLGCVTCHKGVAELE